MPSPETRNWVEMPEEIMGGMILQRLDAVEILTSIQKVCRNWRRICKDPAMWKKIEICHRFDSFDTDEFVKNLSKQAVYRSHGELIDISLKGFYTDDLLDYISRCSSKLNRLCLTGCSNIMDCGLINALERLPHLETLKLSYMSIGAEDIIVIGQNCPQLKSFTLKKEFMDADGDVYAIADSMPTLRHLKLVDSTMDNDDGIQAILNECPHLESLDLRGCSHLHLGGNLEKLCREQIKDFKYTIPEGYDDSEMEFAIYDMNLYVGRGMHLLDDDDDDDD